MEIAFEIALVILVLSFIYHLDNSSDEIVFTLGALTLIAAFIGLILT